MRFTAYAGVLALALLLGACGGDVSSTVSYDEVSAWLEELADDDPAVRAQAAKALGEIWPESARSVPVLAEALDDEAPAVRAVAAASLEALARRGVDPILAFLRDGQDPQRRELLQVVETIRSLGAKVTPKDLAQFITEEPRGGLVHMGVAMGYRRDGLAPNHANRFLFTYLGMCADTAHDAALGIDDPRWPELAAAVCGFSGILALGPSDARPAPAGIVALCEDEDPTLASLGSCMADTWSLGVSHHEPSEPKPPHLGFDDLLRRLGRIQPGLSFGPDARAVRLLVDAVRRQVPELDPLQRRQVAEALRDVWDNEILRWVRTDVVRVVGLLGAEAAMLVPQLTDDLEEAEATWQRDLTEGGETSRPGDIVALQVEYGAKFDRTIVNRLSLTDALGAIGPAAKEAVPLLERLVVEGDPTLRYLAARALRRIHAD